MKKTLWTFDFTIITVGTIISAIGGVAMNFALSLVVFDETHSTLATGLFMAVSFIPSVVIPLMVAPYVDSHNRKHMIVRLDAITGLFYILFTLYLWNASFSYTMYMLFSIVVSSIGSIYSLAYSSLYPDLIPAGFAQKGYAISSMIYPSVTAFITPIASYIYVRQGIVLVCFIEGILLCIAASFEHFIRYKEDRKKEVTAFSLHAYGIEIKEGLQYLKQEKGIRNIYSYMAITNGSAQGITLMTQAFFQSSSILSTTMFAFLSTAEMAGRLLGAIVHYFVKIPNKKRYHVAVSVYATYEGLDILLLLSSYSLMVINRFVAGFLGINSLNIREASTQNYIPSHMRARVNAFFSVIVAICTVLTKLLAGILGELYSYAFVAILFASCSLLAVFFVVMRNRKHIAPIFNQDI